MTKPSSTASILIWGAPRIASASFGPAGSKRFGLASKERTNAPTESSTAASVFTSADRLMIMDFVLKIVFRMDSRRTTSEGQSLFDTAQHVHGRHMAATAMNMLSSVE